MTEAELRIIELLMTSQATRPADLPNWLLALLEDDHSEELTHVLITAATLIYIRRQRPGISLGADPAPGSPRAFATMAPSLLDLLRTLCV
jgi:hypothetical protein